MNSAPIAPYAHRAPFLPSRLTRKLALSAVKNQSQLKIDASSETTPASRNNNWTMLCSIIFPFSCSAESSPVP